MEFILLIGYTIGVYLIGIKRGIQIYLEVEQPQEELYEEEYLEEYSDTSTIDTSKIMIKIEYDDKEDLIFVYEKDTKKFMSHGKTWEEVELKLLERYPNKTFGIDEDNAKELGIL